MDLKSHSGLSGWLFFTADKNLHFYLESQAIKKSRNLQLILADTFLT
jgi:hypothetical protein